MSQPFSQRVSGAVCLKPTDSGPGNWECVLCLVWLTINNNNNRPWMIQINHHFLILYFLVFILIKGIMKCMVQYKSPCYHLIGLSVSYTSLHAVVLNPSHHLPVQVPGVCHTDLQLSCSLTHHPATWRRRQWRWLWGSDPSTPERWGRTASASFRCQETPPVSIHFKSFLVYLELY